MHPALETAMKAKALADLAEGYQSLDDRLARIESKLDAFSANGEFVSALNDFRKRLSVIDIKLDARPCINPPVDDGPPAESSTEPSDPQSRKSRPAR